MVSVRVPNRFNQHSERQKGSEDHVQAPCSPAGHEDVLPLERDSPF